MTRLIMPLIFGGLAAYVIYNLLLTVSVTLQTYGG